jgi:hypothetical protein
MTRIDLIDKKYEAVRKWEPILKNKFPDIVNKSTIEMICLYCEWYSATNSNQQELPTNIIKIKNKIDKSPRIDIVCKSFNPMSGMIEYKLSNGSYVPTSSDMYSYSDEYDDDLMKIFDIEFVKFLYPSKYRESQIDIIL